MKDCSNCHTCGTRLIPVLDGEEWCKTCGQYRRYRSHGWSAAVGENSPCPAPAAEYTTVSLDSAEGDHAAEYRDIWGESPDTAQDFWANHGDEWTDDEGDDTP